MFNRRNLKLYFIALAGIFVLAVLLGVPQKTAAIVESATSGAVYVGQDEIINDNFVKFGQTIDIKGTVNGDVVVVAQTVTIDGTVAGDVLALGSTIIVRGDVKGNVRVAGGNVLFDAKAGKNVSILAGQTQITKDAQIGWSMGCYSGTIMMDGKVGGQATTSAGQITVNGTVGGQLDIPSEAGEIIIGPNAQVGKDVTYAGETKPTIQAGAKIGGEVKQRAAAVNMPKQKDLSGLLGFSKIFWKLAQLFGLLVLGLVVVTILPKETKLVGEKMLTQAPRCVGFGFLVLIVTPIVGVILLFTIVGIPLALVVFALWGIAIMLAKVFVCIVVGQKILGYLIKNKSRAIVKERDRAKDKKPNPMWPLVVGVIVFVLLTSIPYIGWLIKLVAIVWALGAFIEVKRGIIKQQNV